MTKISNEKFKEIMDDTIKGLTIAQIVEKYGVAWDYAREIRKRYVEFVKLWKPFEGARWEQRFLAMGKRADYIEDEVIDRIIDMIDDERTTQDIHAETGVSMRKIKDMRIQLRDYRKLWKPFDGADWNQEPK